MVKQCLPRRRQQGDGRVGQKLSKLKTQNSKLIAATLIILSAAALLTVQYAMVYAVLTVQNRLYRNLLND